MRFLVVGVLVFLCVSPVYGEDALFEKLTEVIAKQCPEVEIDTNQNVFLAKHDTMMYMLHHDTKTGEVSEQARQEEGPRSRGFMLRIGRRDGTYKGQASIPQTIKGPYYPTFIDAPATASGKNHYIIHFSFGRGLDPKLKQAIFEALPRSLPKVTSRQPNKTVPARVNPPTRPDIFSRRTSDLEHTQWIESILKEAKAIKTGMTRGDLLKVFTPEGGLSSRMKRTYAHAKCPLVKVDVEFKPAQPEEKSRELSERQDDKIVKISKPYLAWPVMD